jgi:nitric oxide reductase NorQ protein
MTKQTAIMLQLATADGDNRQQMVVFADKAVFRRSLSPDTRTRWRYASVGDLPTWVEGYINLTKSAPTPMEVSHGPVLMEVTEDEATEAAGGSLARNVGLRFQRVLDAMDADPASTPVYAGSAEDYIGEWLHANTRDDNAWLDTHTHPAGTAKAPAPAAPAAPAAPEPDEDGTTAATGAFTYPAIKGGFITRPNGDRYKVRKVEGVQDVVLIRESRPVREHVFLYGEPGTGKTALVEAAFGTDLVTMLGTEDTEVSDFIGGYTTRGGGTYGWTDGALAEAMERGVPLFIDEVGVIAPKVMTVVFSVMDGRDELRVTANPDRGTIKAKPGFMVIAATNPHAPGVRLSEALLSRFALHMEVTSDYSVARDLGVPAEIVTAAENLDKRRMTGEIGWAPQMRELLRAKSQVTRRGEKIALRNLIASAPEDDREVVIEVIARTTGKKLGGLTL